MRRAVLFLCVSIITVSCLRLFVPGIFAQFVALDKSIAVLGLVISSLGILNATPPLRYVNLRSVYAALGMALLLMTAFTLQSPTYAGMRETYVPVTDIFVMFESGVIALILSGEVYEEATSPFALLSLVAQLIRARISEVPRRIGAAISASSRRGQTHA